MLDDKVVMITGANGGLGEAVTHAFLDADARVAGISRAITNADFDRPNFEAFPATIASAADAAKLVEAVRAKWGRVDALIHLVGGFAGGTPVQETAASDFSKMMELNFFAFAYMAQAVLPWMRERGSGAIVAIGARPAIHPVKNLGAYAASKAALVSLVQTIALENKDRGIRANAVLPGTMDTPANRESMPQADPAKWVHPSNVAALLVHLTSDAGAQMSGGLIPILGADL